MTSPLLIKTLEHALDELQEIPLWGSPPPFPWEIFSQVLSRGLDQTTLALSHKKTEWQPQEALLDGMGDHPVIQPFTLSPLPGTLFWVLAKNSYKTLIQHFLTEDNLNQGLSDPTLQDGFYHYLCLNTLDLFNQQNVYGNLTATLSEPQELPPEGALSIDVAVNLQNTTLKGRLICPRDAHAAFKAHFAMEKPPLFQDPAFKDLPLSLVLTTGSTTLNLSEWKKAKIGDFILLDRCTYDLHNHRGTALLSLGTSPLFDVRIKEGTVKLLEHALIQEETQMTKKHPHEEDPSSEDEDTAAEMESESSEEPLWSGDSQDEPLLPTKEIPLTLTVEVARVQMPLQKVTQLKPGNVLDLSLNPDPHVHLTVGGKRVAKGELVQLGDVLGVKILNLGD